MDAFSASSQSLCKAAWRSVHAQKWADHPPGHPVSLPWEKGMNIPFPQGVDWLPLCSRQSGSSGLDYLSMKAGEANSWYKKHKNWLPLLINETFLLFRISWSSEFQKNGTGIKTNCICLPSHFLHTLLHQQVKKAIILMPVWQIR